MVSRRAYSTWTPQKPTLFDGHYLRNRSTLDIGVLSYIVIVQHKEHSPEVLSIAPGTPCICYIIILNMFRAVTCSSSGGEIVLLQPLVSSLSVNGRTVFRLRANSSPLSTGILYGRLQRVTIPDAVIIQFILLKMTIVQLKTCRGL